MWSNFRNSLSMEGINTTEVILTENGKAEIQDIDTTVVKTSATTASFSDPGELKWKERLQREEIFSSKYRPSVEEEAELKELEVRLGITDTANNKLRNLFKSASSRNVTSADKFAWKAVARPSNQQYPSIVLKRGPCLVLPTKNDDDAKPQQQQQQECELILLTHGLVVAVTKMNNLSSSSNRVVLRQFYAAVPWSNVEFVTPSTLSASNPSSTHWTIIVQPKERYDEDEEESPQQSSSSSSSSFTFACSDALQCSAWLEAMEIVLVRHHEYNCTRQDLGWQYQYVYKPGFTTAVTNRVDLDDCLTTTPAMLNVVDEYNGWTPLHYAIQHHHMSALHSLLEAGADPNVSDREGHTPMFLAVRDQLPAATCALLEQYGAIKSETFYKQQLSDGELFGKVAETEQVMEEKYRQAQQEKEAKAAAAEIKNNLKLLQQRGEQIDEMGNKAADLNQGAQDFASMARQLKVASKKKSKWLPF